MPKYDKKQALKEALKNHDAIYEETDNRTKNILNQEISKKGDIKKNIDNPEFYKRYCLARDIELSKERRKTIATQMQSLVMGKNIEKDTTFNRFLYSYMDDSGTTEAFKHNLKVMQDYYNPSKRAQMVKDAIQVIAHADVNKIAECLTDTTKALEYYHDNPHVVDALFVADNIMSFGLRNGVKGYDFGKDVENMKGFIEIGGNFQALSQKYSNPFIFNFKDPENISVDTAMHVSSKSFPNGQTRSFKECLGSIVSYTGMIKDDNQKINEKIHEHGLDFNKNFFKYKAVNKEGKEVNFLSALTGQIKDTKIIERPEEEAKIFDNLKATEAQTFKTSLDETRDYLLNSDIGKIFFNEQSLDSFAKLNTLNNKQKEFAAMEKPGFFSRLFNTSTNKAYKKAENEIKNIEKDLIENNKLDKDFVDKIKNTENLNLNDFAKDFVNEQSLGGNNKSLDNPEREQISVIEASEKNVQKVAENDMEAINEKQLDRENEINNDPISK